MIAAVVLSVAASCPDPAVLDRQLDAALLALRTGLSLEEVSVIAQVPREYLLPRDGEVLVLMTRADRHRVVQLSLACGYSASGLGSCRVLVPREHTVFVDRTQFDSLKLGRSIAAVLATLCQPEEIVAEADGEVVLTYSTGFPFEAYLTHGPARLRFGRNGRLRQKVGPEQ